MKILSCGVIIKFDNKILLGHVTGQKHWDIPKGIKDEGETALETVIRETFEETGIKLIKENLKSLGEFNYNKSKNLHLFKYELKDLNLEALKCESYFEHFKTKEILPEIDKFNLFTFEESKEKVCQSMKKVFELIEKIF